MKVMARSTWRWCGSTVDVSRCWLVFWELGQANLLVNFDGVQITRWIRVNLEVFVSLTQGQIYCIEASSPSTARFDCSWRVCWYELTIRDGWSWVFVSTSTRPYRCWRYRFCCCYRYRHPITPATWHSCWQASSFSAEKECPLSSSASPPKKLQSYQKSRMEQMVDILAYSHMLANLL